MKKVLSCAFLALSLCALGAQELVKNGNFENIGADGIPAGWHTDEWTARATLFKAEPGQGVDGSAAFLIDSLDKDDAKLIQRIAVKPKSLYRASVRIKAGGLDSSAKGANISVISVMASSESVYDSSGGWTEVSFYGRTGPKQKSLDLAIRLGGYSSLNAGRALYDDVSFVKVDKLPEGVVAQDLWSEPQKKPTDSSGAGPLGVVLFAFAFLALGWTAARLGKPAAPALPDDGKRRRGEILALAALALVGLAIRLPFAMGGWEHPGDLGTFKAWADQAYHSRLANFYRDCSFCDYPPLYIYVLWAVGGLRSILGLAWNSVPAELLIRLPALICDFLLAWTLHSFLRKRAGRGPAFLAAGLVLLNPDVIWNSAAWGQVDSVFSALVLVALLELGESRLLRSGLFYGLACLMKPQGFIFAPIYLFAALADVFLSESSAWKGGEAGGSLLSFRPRRFLPYLGALGIGLGVMALGCLPFVPTKGWTFPFALYTSTISSYPYAVLNASNLWALLGLNYAPLGDPIGASSIKLGSLGLPFIILSTILSALLFARLALRRVRGGEGRSAVPNLDRSRAVIASAGLIIFAVFLFSQKMHERYLYPFVPLAFAWAALDGRLGAFILASVASLAHYLNVQDVLRLSRAGTYQVPADDPLFLTLAAILLACFAVYALLAAFPPAGREGPSRGGKGADGGAGGESGGASGLLKRMFEKDAFPGLGEGPQARFLRPSAAIVLAATLVCLVAGLWKLGDSKVPGNAWTGAPGTSALLDLGAGRDLTALSWYSGIGDDSYSVRTSSDGNSWGPETSIDSSLYCWKSVDLKVQGVRYIQVTDRNGTGRLLELAAWDPAGKLLPLAAVDPSASALCDEQGLARRWASYRDSMYFDEIYHARTAWEYMHGMTAYEWTHPPLGKLIIGIGERIFGMDPLGWRVMGAIVGALLVPLVYLLALLIFPRGWIACGAALLYAIDGMRLVQSRIGTVDTFTMAFLFACFIFMYLYYLSASGPREKRKPWALLLSGICFGLGGATKWNALYVAPALALVFFLAFIPALRADLRAASSAADAAPARKKGKKAAAAPAPDNGRVAWGAVGTIALAFLSFIVIPAGIYALSYLPTMSAPNMHSWREVWALQKQMYDYHANLVAEHAFASPWYTWPWMVRPVWYFKADGLPAGLTSTIAAFGNPLLWWPSLIAAFLAIPLAWKRRDLRILPVVSAFWALLVPWMAIKRLSFLYHYYVIFPFGFLCVIYCLSALWPARPASELPAIPQGGGLPARLRASLSGKTGSWIFIYLAAALVLTIAFYPVYTGFVASRAWVDAMRWLPSWIF